MQRLLYESIFAICCQMESWENNIATLWEELITLVYSIGQHGGGGSGSPATATSGPSWPRGGSTRAKRKRRGGTNGSSMVAEVANVTCACVGSRKRRRLVPGTTATLSLGHAAGRRRVMDVRTRIAGRLVAGSRIVLVRAFRTRYIPHTAVTSQYNACFKIRQFRTTFMKARVPVYWLIKSAH